MPRNILASAFCLLAACAAPSPSVPPAAGAPGQVAGIDLARAEIEAIERRTGGRLGVMLADADGLAILSHRADERFAMCSTFKLALAAMVLDGAEAGRWRLDDRLAVTRDDLLPNSPVSERRVAAGSLTLEEAAAAIVTVSDNSAANLVLRRVGGPLAFTAWLRANGDHETRLDRTELALNENRPGDPRDTTTPRAMAATTARLMESAMLSPDNRKRVRRWTAETRTGARRIRAGLPAGWEAGDKTGSCGTAWNDVAWFTTPAGRTFVLAVYLDRPTVDGPAAETAIAGTARILSGLID